MLIPPDPFAQTDFHVFCSYYRFLSCVHIPPFAVYSSAKVPVLLMFCRVAASNKIPLAEHPGRIVPFGFRGIPRAFWGKKSRLSELLQVFR